MRRTREPVASSSLSYDERASVAERHHAIAAIDVRGARAEDHLAFRFCVKCIRLQEKPLALERAGEIGLRQRRTLVRRIGFVAHHGERALVAFAAQARDSLRAGLACADNDDPIAHATARNASTTVKRPRFYLGERPNHKQRARGHARVEAKRPPR